MRNYQHYYCNQHQHYKKKIRSQWSLPFRCQKQQFWAATTTSTIVRTNRDRVIPTKAYSSSSTSSRNTQALLARTLYRQILKWAKRTGSEVPFDPLPPLTLMPPRIDVGALQQLLAVKQMSSMEISSSSSSSRVQEGKGTTTVNGEDMLDQTTNPYAAIKYIATNIMPVNTIVRENQIIVPIYNATDVKNAMRMIYRLNHINATNEFHQDLDTIKDRVSLGFQVLKSLNQLSEMLDERKMSREQHMDREGVAFHVGQVVQHKYKRWRGVVCGWQKVVPHPQNVSALNVAQKSSLTQKVYNLEVVTNDESKDNHVSDREPESSNRNSSSTEVEYVVHLDEGDAAFSRTRVLGSMKVKQHELDPVINDSLKRVRNSLLNHHFSKFDATRMAFVPGSVLEYEYPDDIHAANQDHARDQLDESRYDLAKHENAKRVLTGVKNMVSILQRIILDTSSCVEERNLSILVEVERRLIAIANGQFYENMADKLSSSHGMSSSHKLAIKSWSSLTNIAIEINNILWQRQRAKENIDRVHFPLGSVVKHKKYGFRGVVTAWDPYPQTDVTNWDGLQDLEGDVHSMPFYHIIPDLNDTVKAFGQERPFRYVCQENLILCPEHELDIEVTLDEGWSASDGNQEFVAPDALKFSHFEEFAEDEIIDACLKDLQINYNRFFIDIRNSVNEECSSIDHLPTMEDLINLLRYTECFEDAMSVEEGIKEIWKANSDAKIRYDLHHGIAHLLRGDKRTALSIYDRILEDDPKCLEAWNKKATCHYMLGDMCRSEDAAQRVLDSNGQHFQALAGLGLVYCETKQYQKAIDYFEKCISLNPWSTVSSRLLVCFDALVGHDTKAGDRDD